ncbi:1-acyl-sn-glycerol-3-phosphate acyltransferase [Symbiobacterium terraclitae]|jgi:1-acyl-sn-glycerol-3-phosphate acyltransferase|uniref:1-acyl-sn-glycerol-3-phosphate acyltransferase n=1 Tax=Symbiobacterium terraclitae TaxID=557451 RepID=A0ABS4JMW7_9FIRM|nr:lysophospholipid acyltransferase family protein [Symbiobacterium terraclitae]MBP2016874.1 1-acyl-sn-glycerol-3-phosphate acyltransferase [Symbiobacterium terraclitae]
MWLYGFGKAVVGTLYHLIYRIEAEGVENIPATGGVILCGNHINAQDPLIIGIASPRPVCFMAKEELFRSAFLRFLIRGLGAFPVRRGSADRASLKHALSLLAEGKCFGIFPEGTRSPTGELKKPEPGTAYIALKSGVPVIPVGITSTYRLFSPVRIRFGPPVDLERFRDSKLNGATLEQASEAIADAISHLLDPPGLPRAQGRGSP